MTTLQAYREFQWSVEAQPKVLIAFDNSHLPDVVHEKVQKIYEHYENQEGICVVCVNKSPYWIEVRTREELVRQLTPSTHNNSHNWLSLLERVGKAADKVYYVTSTTETKESFLN